MYLSVIIVNYNVRYFLEQCLNSVIKASEGIDCEIFVVDNNSADGSCAMVSTCFSQVRLIRNKENAGFAKACNQAIRQSSGEFILLLNPDTIVDENAFTECLGFMRSHTDAGALGVKMIDGNGRYLRESKRAFPSPLTAFFKMAGFSKAFPLSPLFSRYYMAHIDIDQIAEIEVLPGAFMFIRKETLEKTGLLDENFFMYGEDIDLSYRIINAGYKIYYYPEVKIIHFKGESSKRSPLNSTILFYRAMLVFSEKHFRGKNKLLFEVLIKPAIYARGTVSLITVPLLRLFPGHGNIFRPVRKSVIVSREQSYLKISDLIKKTGVKSAIAGRVAISKEDMESEVLGNIEQLKEVIRINHIGEVIFSVKDMPVSRIIESMNSIAGMKLKIRLVPEGEKIILSSKTVTILQDTGQ